MKRFPTTRDRTTIGPRYKWIALSNTTLGILMAAIKETAREFPSPFRGWG